MSEYERECTFCQKKIQMSNEGGAWKPYNLNNGIHDCRNNKQTKQEQTANQEARLAETIKQLQQIIKQLEALQKVETIKQ